MKQVEIFTDGACLGNPGPGGYGIILKYKGTEKELSGGEPETTNNRMELTAAIVALEALKTPCEIKLFSDSQYLINAFELGWLEKWKTSGWKRAGNEVVKNADLWQRLSELTALHKVEFIWVRGHDGHPENERCDRLAAGFAQKLSAETRS
ncbi:MAG TPA: ribonuclease HI [Oscillospiraceae bacterium]|nr:ribonuclease HI [Oscillospiraceae bacterium]HPS33681.1 ribonuclease HI [Oscillospiraceae bacterium]